MTLPFTSIKLKKLPYYLLLLLLTAGASLIIGFLSFSGLFALFPVVLVAAVFFGLSVLYEGEIYFQNIKGAFKKIFREDYLDRSVAREYLLLNFPEKTSDEECPQFFRDYKC